MQLEEQNEIIKSYQNSNNFNEESIQDFKNSLNVASKFLFDYFYIKNKIKIKDFYEEFEKLKLQVKQLSIKK